MSINQVKYQLQHKRNIEKLWVVRYTKAMSTNNSYLVGQLDKERSELQLFNHLKYARVID